ncbi:MAG TPA: hypothetical protein P5523_07865 [Bacteroidales bacterium]|nr:hypothetical protein [Bacteroidales bacterium]
MASYNKFQPFVEAVAEKKHNLGSDTLKVALTNTAPTADSDALTDITEIDYTYCSDRALTVSSSSQTSGTYKLVVADKTISASGGAVGPFRYVVIYNDTATNDDLICWFDYGSSITLADGESIVLDFDDSNGLLTIS